MARRTQSKTNARGRRRARATQARTEDTADLKPVDLGTAQEAQTAAPRRNVPPAPEVAPVEYRDMGFMRKSWSDLARTLKEAAQWQQLRHTPYGLAPAAFFAFAFLVGGFDGRIFGLVLPDIVRDLNINAISLLNILNLVGFVYIFGTVALAYYLDRIRRLPFVGGGTIISGLGSLFIPHVGTIGPLAGLTIGSDTGDQASSIPYLSLMADYYPPESRGRAFALTGTLNRFGFYLAPWIIGLLALHHGWRFPFYISGPLVLLSGALILVFLREPVRGFMERRAAGLSDTESRQAEPPVSFGQAWRTIWGIRTLRRLFISDIVGGVGDRLFGFVYVFFLFQTYKLDVLARGKLFTLTGAFAIVGGFIGGGLVDSLIRRRPQRVLIFSGAVSALRGVSLVIIALHPP